jgi:hypothetical protein
MTEADFIDGILLRGVPFDVPGLGCVEVRGLSMVEIGDLRSKHTDDPVAQVIGAVRAGLLTPKLSETGIKALHDGNPGPIVAISNRIFELSGQGNRDVQDPLAGNGLSPS